MAEHFTSVQYLILYKGLLTMKKLVLSLLVSAFVSSATHAAEENVYLLNEKEAAIIELLRSGEPNKASTNQCAQAKSICQSMGGTVIAVVPPTTERPNGFVQCKLPYVGSSFPIDCS